MKKINVTYNGKIVGSAEVEEDSGVVEIELEDSDFENMVRSPIQPGDFSLASMSEPEERTLLGYSNYDVNMMDLYYKNRPKGTFDA